MYDVLLIICDAGPGAGRVVRISTAEPRILNKL